MVEGSWIRESKGRVPVRKHFSGETSDSLSWRVGSKRLKPAALGACIGLLSGYPAGRKKSIMRSLTYGLLGGTVGLCAGLVWENRRLTASVAGSALRNIGKVRDERWLAKHPIDYA